MALSLKNIIGKTSSEADTAKLLAWINNLPLANPPEAQSILIAKLTEMNGESMTPASRITLLDTLFKPLATIQSECAPRYVGKPLPLSASESLALDTSLKLRRLALAGYERCVEDSLKDGRVLATALQRTLATLAALLADMLKARLQPDEEFWKALNGRAALAESRGLLTTPVQDPVRHKERLTTSLAAYGEAILLYTASPHELPSRQVHWMGRWARRWAAKLEISEKPPKDMSAIPLNVDLDASRPPLHLPGNSHGARFLLTGGIRKSIKTRLSLLEKGKTPAELQLGEDCFQPACGALLERMYQRWCKGGVERRLERREENLPSRAVAGMEPILHLMLGRPVTDFYPRPKPTPVKSSPISSLVFERERLATFGSVESLAPPSVPVIAELPPAPPPPFEHEWRVLSESVTGLSMVRPLKLRNAARLSVGKLLAVEVPGSTVFLLSVIRWLTVSGENLRVGVELLPSPVQALIGRCQDDPATPCPAFLLPAAPDGSKPATLITAPGVFRVDRIVEIPGPVPRSFKLLRPLERGEDFEQLVFE